MVRIIGGLVGLAFALLALVGFGVTTYGAITDPAPESAEHEFHLAPKKVSFPSDGMMGKFDRQQLQRGYQVYKEVCSACHSVSLLSFRDLSQLGYSEAEVKAEAAKFTVPSINPETGEAATRPATPADKFPLVYPNAVAARAANNNAIPPDLSLIAKARAGGPQYIYSLLTGYEAQQPEKLVKEFPGSVTPPGLHYNPYFANLNIAMPPPLLTDGQVTYADGTQSTIKQNARDVSAFLVWAAEPNLEKRHSAGLASLIFLVIFAGLTYGAYRSVWRDAKG